jgi:hypothetical protein
MNIMKSGVIALAILAAPLAASAATITQSATPDTAFTSIFATEAVGTFIENTAGSSAGVRKSPWEGTVFADNAYASINGTATFTLDPGSLQNAISFVWGSPDSYNSIQFFKSGVAVAFDSLSGTQVTGYGPNNIANAQVTVRATDYFDSFRFTSTQAAFEYANLEVSAVPLPAGGLLLIAALGGAAALRRRKAPKAA